MYRSGPFLFRVPWSLSTGEPIHTYTGKIKIIGIAMFPIFIEDTDRAITENSYTRISRTSRINGFSYRPCSPLIITQIQAHVLPRRTARAIRKGVNKDASFGSVPYRAIANDIPVAARIR